MLRGGGVLADDLAAFVVFRRGLAAGKIAHVQRDVPIERRSAVPAALFGVADGFRERLAFAPKVGANVRVADGPKPESVRRCRVRGHSDQSRGLGRYGDELPATKNPRAGRHSHANISFTTCPFTSVRRKSRPL